jgi:hypothetical protein
VNTLEKSLGFLPRDANHDARRARLHRCIHLQLLALGLPTAVGGSPADAPDSSLLDVAESLLSNYRQKSRLLEEYRCPVDVRIEAFLQKHLADTGSPFTPRLPSLSFILDQHGLARELSLPLGAHDYHSPLVKSYRVRNGVLHNPLADRRTTQGTFHVTEGGLPIPADKIAVPKRVFAELFHRAVHPPRDLMVLPFTAKNQTPAEVFVSLLLRPVVCPAVPGVTAEKSMEVRFFSPGSLVSNLDFVESIFGNAGDPVLAENDASLDVEHWTGHTGCVILAPHLTNVSKKELGLPHFDGATPRQQRDGMCWKDESEKYNNGSAFKLTCRTSEGVIVTLIADNYFGYCKKEVKTQISYAANLFGNCEEEHAGGALVFPSYSLGDEYRANGALAGGKTFADLVRDCGPLIKVQAEGYAIDARYDDIIYVPEDAVMNVRALRVSWTRNGQEQSLPLLTDHHYVTPWGERIFVDKHPGSGRFRLVTTVGEGTFCHKPCTVSGGGKSEISKSLSDYMIYGPVYVGNLEKDLDAVQSILDHNHTNRWKPGRAPRDYSNLPARPILSEKRSLGSVIKLLTPSPDYTDEYNAFLATIPSDILSLVLLIKRLYRPEWGSDWRSHFSVDVVNGEPGHELKVDDRKAAGMYLRVGFLPNQAWRTFRLRQDFYPAMKLQTEDDISATTVVPAAALRDFHVQSSRVNTDQDLALPPSLKVVKNCEYRLFQRPDDAIHPGFDKQAESDLSEPDNFLSNFEPQPTDAQSIANRIIESDLYTPPMHRLIHEAAHQSDGYVVISSRPRLVDGKPSKNPRYLQSRPDIVNPSQRHLLEMGLRLARSIPADKPVIAPVDAVLFGRRNNPPEAKAKIRSLAVFSPIHYQELPELFMEFICSLTGKSPSTTGAGSEGALTKGPFNALPPIVDLNTALVSYALTGLSGFSTSAGFIGPNVRVDHDLSLMIPELWSRLRPEERDPKFLIDNGHLEKLQDFTHNGRTIQASRLGYRITYSFVRTFFGRLFSNPGRVFDEAILKPETQDIEAFIDGIDNITEAHKRVARHYYDDGSIDQACPPLKALLHIMAHGHYNNRTESDPQIRALFERTNILQSDWYHQRLRTKQSRDIALWQRHVHRLHTFMNDPLTGHDAMRLNIPTRLNHAQLNLSRISSPEHLTSLQGTTGADPALTQ